MESVPDHEVLVAGDTLVDFMPAGDGEPTTDFAGKFGGSAANVAMALSRIGAPPLFWTRLATDSFGQFLAGVIAESDISEEYVVRDADAKTTLAFVSHDADGERGFSFYREGTADTRMQPGTVTDETLADVSWVHLTGVTLSVEPSRTATLELAERAHEAGCTVSLDPNARPEMWHSTQEFAAVVRGALDHVDVLKATPADLAVAGFEASDPAALARSITAHGPETVFLTLGGSGSLVYGAETSPFAGVARHAGYDVDVVDTTGAGDGFLAGAIAAMTNGVTDAERVLAVANAVGAVTTTQPGAVTALTGPDPVAALCGDVPWV
jgi:fructokinase